MPALPPDALAQLLDRGVVTPAQVEECRAGCADPSDPQALVDVLLARGFLDASELEALGWAHDRGRGTTLVLGELGAAPGQIDGVPADREVPRVAPLSADWGGVARRLQEVEALPPGRRIGRFEIVREVGRGGMGVVYQARDPRLDRRVALKGLAGALAALSETAARRFRREALATARLRHPAIVPVHELLEADGQSWLVLDYVEGVTLGEHLRRTGAGAAAAALLLLPVAEAVAFAHAQGVLHRDLKPDNILVDAQGRPYVVDFGLARVAEEDGGRLTEDGEFLGTPHYMAPEQVRGDPARVGPVSDVYALGAVLYHALAGRPPFDGTTLAELAERVLLAAATPPSHVRPGIPPALDAICLRCLEKAPEARYPGAAEVADDLRRFLAGEPVQANETRTTSRVIRWGRRRRKLLPVAAGLLLALALALGGAWRMRIAARDRHAALLERTARSVAELEDQVRRTPLTPDARTALERQSLAVLDELLASDPEAGVAYAWRGTLFALAGRPEEAEADFAHALALAPEDATVLYLRGTDALRRYAAARGLPQVTGEAAGLTRAPADAETEDQRRLRLRGLAELARATRPCAGAPESAPGFGAAERNLGRARAALYGGEADRFPRALQEVEGVAGPHADEVRAIASYYRGEFEAAVAAYDRVLARWPEYVLAWSGRGQARFALGVAGTARDPRETWQAAIRDFDEALARVPGDAFALLNRANARLMLARWEDARGGDGRGKVEWAIADLEALRRSEDYRGIACLGLSTARIALARMVRARGGDAPACLIGAMQDAEAAGAHGVDPALVAGNRGLALEGMADQAGQTPAAREKILRSALGEFERAVALAPVHASLRAARGRVHRAMAELESAKGGDPRSEYDLAAADLVAALRSDAGQTEARRLLAFVRRDRAAAEGARGGDPRPGMREALAEFGELTRLRPEEHATFTAMARLRVVLAQAERARGGDTGAILREAVADADRAIALRADLLDPRLVRSAVLLALGDRDSAAGLDPRDPYRRAIEDADAVLAHSPRAATAWLNRGSAGLGLARAQAKRGEDAAASFARAETDLLAAIDAGEVGAWVYVGVLRRELGRSGEAIAAFEQAGVLFPAGAAWARAQIEEIRRKEKEAAGK